MNLTTIFSLRDVFVASLGFFAIWSLTILRIGIHIGEKNLDKQILINELRNVMSSLNKLASGVKINEEK